MVETFGNAGANNGPEARNFRIKLYSEPLDLSWHHCGATSDFLGEFFSNTAKPTFDRTDARHSIGYMVNEILENAIKFRHGGDVEIDTSLQDSRFEIRIQNVIGSETASRFKDLLKSLLARDPGELLLERIEENALDENSSGSGLGLLTLMSDYDAKLGWSFAAGHASDGIALTTFAALELS